LQNDEPVFDYHLAFEAVKFYLGRFSEDSLEGPDFIASAAYQAAIYIDALEKEIKFKDNHSFEQFAHHANYELLLHELEVERHEKRVLEKRISKLSRDIGNSLN
jgi:hypothetical protein